ncbi:MAG: peptidoglycan DD-metalloendopeptidase family protein [Desulfobulbaceae bacterium]|nr:peptidoglycan DD-metalloendopeptidase family protein [Desulfobulbaceae bacterium]
MDPRLHIIVSSEQGHAKTFVISKPVLKRILTAISIIFVISTIAGITYSIENYNLKGKINNLESNVSTLSTEKDDLQYHVTSLENKAKAQLTGAYGELNQRSQVIDSILSVLDISSPSSNENPGQNQGGPFTKLSDESLENLILKVDRDIQTIQPIPLGYPVDAKRLTSKFGKRVDPINGRNGFHDGIDFSGTMGSEVRATADGKIIARGRNATYGWYVKIDHGNDFMTMYAHNSKILAPWGTEVKRGDVISLLGNTGRSTGPHLHYEVRYKNRPIDPAKFININKLVAQNNV